MKTLFFIGFSDSPIFSNAFPIKVSHSPIESTGVSGRDSEIPRPLSLPVQPPLPAGAALGESWAVRVNSGA